MGPFDQIVIKRSNSVLEDVHFVREIEVYGNKKKKKSCERSKEKKQRFMRIICIMCTVTDLF